MANLNSAPIVFFGQAEWPFCLPELQIEGEVVMFRATSTLRWLLCFALLEVVRSNLLLGQEDDRSSSGTGFSSTSMLPIANSAPNLVAPASTNLFRLPAEMASQYESGRYGSGDALAFQFDRGSASAWLTETYLTNPLPFVGLHPAEWSNGLSAGGTWFLTKSNTTAAHFMGDLQSSTTDVGGFPFEQFDGSYLTLRWGISHLFLSNTGRNDVQIDVAGYGERIVSPPHLPIASYMADPTGYASASGGVEATFNLPSRSVMFSVRFGSERVVLQPTRSHLFQFGISWSW